MILLDTHTLVWWVNETPQLSLQARQVIRDEVKDGEVVASAISAWKIGMLVQERRMTLASDIDTWFGDLDALPYFRFISVDVHIAKTAIFLTEPFHNDPADRIIVATALRLAVPIVTADTKVCAYSHVRTIW